MKPLHGNIVIEPFNATTDKYTKTESGLFVGTEKSNDNVIRHSKVIFVGDGKNEQGSLVGDMIKVGQTVVYTKFAQVIDLTNDGSHVQIINVRDVLAVRD